MDAFTARHLQGVSRTYAIVVPMLPAELADAVGIAYLLMRVVDTLEDAPELSPAEREALLVELDRALAGDAGAAQRLARPRGETAEERALMQEVPEVLGRVQALPEAYRGPIGGCARAMSGGVRRLMARAAARGRPYPAVESAEELREYCHYVAGVVGEMLCAMMAHYLKRPGLLRLREIAVELGIGLQLVNILKDALGDAEHGRRYLPIAEGGGRPHAEVYRAVLQQARQSLLTGIDYVLALPAELRSFCGLPIAWGALTLARAEQDQARAKIGRGVIGQTIDMFRSLGSDDQKLRQWLSGMLRRESGGVVVEG